MALFQDAYTISSPRTGDATIRNLVLRGWCANYSKLLEGRLFFRVNTSDELELFNNKDYLPASLVCSGLIAADNTVTLDENNSSGISGSALVQHTDAQESIGDIIVSYASEEDMLQYQKCVTDFLDENGQFNGEDRFENPLKRSKIYLDKQIYNKLQPFFRHKASFEPDLSAIAKPRQIAEAHALYALFLVFKAVNSGDNELDKFAKGYDKMSTNNLDLTQIELDHENDDIINDKRSPSGSRLTR